MSAVVCGKRSSSIFDELLTLPPTSKRVRCSAGSSSPTPSLRLSPFQISNPLDLDDYGEALIVPDNLVHLKSLFLDMDQQDAHKQFDKANILYDQAREKYLSLKKSTRADVATVLEDELHSARSSFEQAHLIWLLLFLTRMQRRDMSFWRLLVELWMHIFVTSNTGIEDLQRNRFFWSF